MQHQASLVIYAMANSMKWDRREVIDWFLKPNILLNGKSPFTVIKDGEYGYLKETLNQYFIKREFHL